MDAAISAWLAACRSGTIPDREEFLSRYPDVSSELRRFLANYDSVQERMAAEEMAEAVAANQSANPPQSIVTAVELTQSAAEMAPVSANARYRQFRLFKRGGLGTIYRAYDESLHRETAVKFIGDAPATDPLMLTRFRIEAEITGRLDHPGVVPVYGIGDDGSGKPFYAMRLIKGRELTEAIKDYHAARIARRSAAELRRQLLTLLEHLVSACKTIAYAHDVGIIHCDIKPANIMVGKYGETIVLDWGLAITYERSATYMANGQTILRPRSSPDASGSETRGGTYGYISPEQLSPDEAIAPTSDIYSLGATLYEILTSKPPFDGHDRNVCDQIRHGHFPHPRSVVGTIPRRLEAICLKAMSAAPRQRYLTANQLALDLTNWMRDDPLIAVPDHWYHRLFRFAYRHRAITISTMLGILALAVQGVWTVYQDEKNRYVKEQNELVQRSLNTSLETFESLCRPMANGEMNNLGVFQPFADKIDDFTKNYLSEFGDSPMMAAHTGRVFELRATVLRIQPMETDQALDYYRKAQSSYEEQLHKTTDPDQKQDLERRLGHLLLNEGSIYVQREEYTRAESILRTARESSEIQYKQDPEDLNLGRDLAEVYHLLGQVSLYRDVSGAAYARSLQESEDFFLQSADLRDKLRQLSTAPARRSQQHDLTRDLARSHGYLGDLYAAQGLIAKAERSYTISKNLRDELLHINRSDPEYRFQYARALGNFGALERNYKGNLERAIAMLEEAEKYQSSLVKEFDEVNTFHLDLAYGQNSLAEVYLWRAVEEPAQQQKFMKRCREAAENVARNLAKFHSRTDLQWVHGRAWSCVTLATLEKMEGANSVAAQLADEARRLLTAQRGQDLNLGRSELVTLALAASLQGDLKSSLTALKDAVERGENTAVRFEKLSHTGLKGLANDPTYGPQFHELCRIVAESLKND